MAARTEGRGQAAGHTVTKPPLTHTTNLKPFTRDVAGAAAATVVHADDLRSFTRIALAGRPPARFYHAIK